MSLALNCTQTANALSAAELKLRTHWVQPNSNCELIDYQWVRMHSKFCTQLRLHSNCELIECQWVRLHSKSCTQTTNSLSAAALKLRTYWLSVSSYAFKVLHSTAVTLKLRTHWVQPNSNCELIDNQWVRMHSKLCTQLRLHSNFALSECNRTQIANSLIISEFVCTQSFALNCTQKMN